MIFGVQILWLPTTGLVEPSCRAAGRISKEGKQLRRLSVLVVLIAVIATACGGGEGDDVGEDVFGGIGQASGDVEPGEQGSSDGGTLDEPTPEASSALPADSMRIGDSVWERTIPSDGQCFVQEDDGTISDSGTVWGSVSNDQGVEFKVSHGQDGGLSAQISSNLMGWNSGVKDGTELTIQLDFETNTMSGEGLFYNTHTNEWAYGSFTFTCSDSE